MVGCGIDACLSMDMPNSWLEVCPAPRILGGQCPESSSHRDPSSQSPAPRQGFEARPKASKKLGVSMFFLSEKVKRDEKSLCDHLFSLTIRLELIGQCQHPLSSFATTHRQGRPPLLKLS